MSHHRLVPLVVAALVFASGGQRPSAGGRACLDAPAAGAWELPSTGSGATGLIDGRVGRFRLVGLVRDVPTPCLSCSGGVVTATLDDGVGTGPDFVVDGSYQGAGLLLGPGRFELGVRRSGGTVALGTIRGEFLDLDFVPGPGTFAGRARICP